MDRDCIFLTSFGLAYVARERSTLALTEGMPQIEKVEETAQSDGLEVPDI